MNITNNKITEKKIVLEEKFTQLDYNSQELVHSVELKQMLEY